MSRQKKILLVEPKFPLPNKSKNHHNFLPIGLLKLASFYRSLKYKIKLVRGNLNKKQIPFKPDKIMVTSLFTYWSKYVRDCVQHYKKLYPDAKIIVGGIYASLMPEHCKKYTGCDEVYVGINKRAEKYKPAYDLANNPEPLGYQIIHASRGCFRRCEFCGTWKIEPRVTYKKSIKDEICSNRLIFYDNNFLSNPNIKSILNEIIDTKYNGKSLTCESQSGFDGRLLNLETTKLLKKANFVNPRIAWDDEYWKHKEIKKQIDILLSVGYKNKDIYVFMLYNWDLPFKKMEKKRIKCWEWKVQIVDCRFRPLNQIFDDYNPMRKQTNDDYHIHPKWTDGEVKQFRKNVRRQNICVRHDFKFYSKDLEEKHFSKKMTTRIKSLPKYKVRKLLKVVWFPDKVTPPKKTQ